MSAIQPLTPAVGALIHHIDLSLPLSSKDKAFIEESLLNHKVVFFVVKIFPHNSRLISHLTLGNYIFILFILMFQIIRN